MKFLKSISDGFTLAEVLITLGIIGVVAAMTLPTLQQKLDERSNITALKKFYTEFSNATNLLIYDFGQPEVWGLKIMIRIHLNRC